MGKQLSLQTDRETFLSQNFLIKSASPLDGYALQSTILRDIKTNEDYLLLTKVFTSSDQVRELCQQAERRKQLDCLNILPIAGYFNSTNSEFCTNFNGFNAVFPHFPDTVKSLLNNAIDNYSLVSEKSIIDIIRGVSVALLAYSHYKLKLPQLFPQMIQQVPFQEKWWLLADLTWLNDSIVHPESKHYLSPALLKSFKQGRGTPQVTKQDCVFSLGLICLELSLSRSLSLHSFLQMQMIGSVFTNQLRDLEIKSYSKPLKETIISMLSINAEDRPPLEKLIKLSSAN